MNEIGIIGTITVDLDVFFSCIKALSLIDEKLASIKYRIFGEEINYEDARISVYVYLYKYGAEKEGTDKRNDYLFDCSFLESESIFVEPFLLELSELLRNQHAIYSFEYSKNNEEVEINNYSD